MTASATGPSAYSTLQIALHWIIAGLIVMQFLIQDAIELAFDRRADGEAGLPSAWAILHIVIGSMVLVLARVRRHAAAVRRATAAGAAPDLRVQVQAEQFWWRVTYDLPDGPIESANEVHLPAGAVTEFVLTGADIWLLGLSFIEVAAIAAAVELIVGVLKCRAPGMHINLTPLYGWYVLVVGAMILFAFPPLIAGDILFELQRAFEWPFFDPARGGDPLLWQHLFWIFGHPEVYIIFLPSTARPGAGSGQPFLRSAPAIT